MNRTPIEWVKNPDGTPGYTLNDKTGCLNGCPYCYARILANGRLQQRYLANHNVAGYPDCDKFTAFNDPFYPRYWPEKLEQIRKRKKPAGIFLNDMSDWMGSYWPEEWTEAELQVMRDCPQHRFYTLTKQPQNLPKFSPFPDNCWVGVSVPDEHLQNWGLFLRDIVAKIKYLSFEPLLHIPDWWTSEKLSQSFKKAGIRWVIIGALTCKKSELSTLQKLYPDLTPMPYGNKWTLQPKLEWVEEICDACGRVKIPIFLKDNLDPMFADNDCKLFLEYREKLFTFTDFEGNNKTRWQIRQEMPSESFTHKNP